MGKKRAMLIGLDGADPVVIKRMISEGKLPNLKKVMAQGAHTENLDMLGVFPTVTPPNWTTLATGNYPKTHGITCFGNHTLGKSLGTVELNWDSRRVESELIWEAFEDEDKRCIMMNYCQAWPNRVPGSKNIFIDGTGMIPFLRSAADFQKYVMMDQETEKFKEVPHDVRKGSGDCVVYGDQIEDMEKASEKSNDDLIDFESQASNFTFQSGEYSEDPPMLDIPAFVMMGKSFEKASQSDVVDRLYSPLKAAQNWKFDVPENALEGTYVMNSSLERRQVLVTASDGVHYDTITLYKNKRVDKPLGSAKVGEWSDWVRDTFMMDEQPVNVAYKIRVTEVAENGSKAAFYLPRAFQVLCKR